MIFSVIGLSVKAAPAVAEDNYRRSYGDAFIFTEGGVEFAVFPDGQFDFFYHPRFRGNNFSFLSQNINISYNAGYNYDPYVQYDDFGAVVQIESVPVYYDFYGRIIQAGHVQISYNHFGMLSRIGHLYLHYNPYNQFTGYSGYINARNPYYVHRPWHRYYMRPHSYASVVYYEPYRAYYYPNRIKYKHYRNYYEKHDRRDFRRSYYRPGEPVASYHRGRRTEAPRTVRTPYSDERSTGSFENNYSRDDHSVSKRDLDRNPRQEVSRTKRVQERPQVTQQRVQRRQESIASPGVEREVRSQSSARSYEKRKSASADTSGTRTRSSRGRQ